MVLLVEFVIEFFGVGLFYGLCFYRFVMRMWLKFVNLLLLKDMSQLKTKSATVSSTTNSLIRLRHIKHCDSLPV
jgi:hypothetical protein